MSFSSFLYNLLFPCISHRLSTFSRQSVVFLPPSYFQRRYACSRSSTFA